MRVEILGRERLLAQKFVEKAVVDGRADAQLHVGKKLEHRRGQQVRRRVAEDLQRVGILRRENRERSVVLERPREVHQLAVGARHQRLARQAVRDLSRDLRGRGAARHFLRGSVRQCDLDGIHGDSRRGEKTLR